MEDNIKAQSGNRPAARRMKRLIAAAVLTGSIGSGLVAGHQPATASCDFPADITISDASVVEGTSSNWFSYTAMKFTVTNVANATSVDWKAFDGPPPTVPGWSTAVVGSDYVASSGTLQLDGNPKTIVVWVRRDATKEPHEVMSVLLANAKGCLANIADQQGIGRIYNDD